MNDPEDTLVDSLLEEALGGRRPPNLRARILQAWAMRSFDSGHSADTRPQRVAAGLPPSVFEAPEISIETGPSPARGSGQGAHGNGRESTRRSKDRDDVTPPVAAAAMLPLAGPVAASLASSAGEAGAGTAAASSATGVATTGAGATATTGATFLSAKGLLLLGGALVTAAGVAGVTGYVTHLPPAKSAGEVVRSGGEQEAGGSRSRGLAPRAAAGASGGAGTGSSGLGTSGARPVATPRQTAERIDEAIAEEAIAEADEPAPEKPSVDEPPAADEPASEEQPTEKPFRPPPKLNDYAFVRRAYLTLVGRPPTPEEITAFARSEEDNRRDTLITQLVASPESAEYFGLLWADRLWREGPPATEELRVSPKTLVIPRTPVTRGTLAKDIAGWIEKDISLKDATATWYRRRFNPDETEFAAAVVNEVWLDLFGSRIAGEFADPTLPTTVTENGEELTDAERESLTPRQRLLARLAHKFEREGCRLRPLILAIALTNSFERQGIDPASDVAVASGDTADGESAVPLGHFVERPLSPHQFRRTIERLIASKEGLHGYVQPNDPASLKFLMDEETLERLTRFGGAGALAQAVQSGGSLPSRVERLYLAALSRKPSKEELADAQRFLASHQEDTAGALKELWWSLLMSPEFLEVR